MHINNNLSKKILSWYDNNKRALPWRVSQKFHRNQYYRILSEFMLQQTQVKTVIPYFLKFTRKIPTLKILSNSKEKKILKLWEGLGYYRRVKNLHQTAKILIKEHNGKLPNKLEEIKKLPGIGDYTGNALLSIVYNQPKVPFDGNVKRVFLRLFGFDTKKNQKEIKKIINNQFNTKRNGDLAEALMEFGSIVCKPDKPLCDVCNLKKNCKFFKNNTFILKKLVKKTPGKEKKYNVYCYLKERKKEIALRKNENLSFLKNFKIPNTEIVKSHNNIKGRGWIYLCKYKNNISNIKMDINLFYKFIKNKPKQFMWYSIEHKNNEFIPSFTKKIFKKVSRAYR